MFANSASLTIGNSVYYGVHEVMTQEVLKRRDGERLSVGHRVVIGGLTGVIYWWYVIIPVGTFFFLLTYVVLSG